MSSKKKELFNDIIAIMVNEFGWDVRFKTIDRGTGNVKQLSYLIAGFGEEMPEIPGVVDIRDLTEAHKKLDN